MRSLLPFWPLIALAGVLSIVEVAIVAAGRTSPSPDSEFVMSLGVGLFLVLWMVQDAQRRNVIPCHEFGFLVGVFLPVSLVWYVFWTRGWSGALLLAGLAGVILVPWICGLATSLMIHAT